MRSLRTVTIAAATVLGLAFSFAGPSAAGAQDAPSYATQGASADDAQIRGRVVAFDGGYALTVRDDRGYSDNVQLHEGTIINPTGLTLAPGMVVSILGFNQGSSFSANEIDTPYSFVGGDPYYAGHPWNYYGPSIGLSFFFGNQGWWHGGYFNGGGYRYAGGARFYGNAHVRSLYGTNAPGGTFHGRSYVAPRSAGGYHASGASRGAGGNGGGGGAHHH